MHLKRILLLCPLTGWDSRWPQYLSEIITWWGLLFCCYLCCSFTVQEEAPLHFVAVPSECLLLCKSRNHTLEVSFRKRKGMVLRALKVGFSVRHNRQVVSICWVYVCERLASFCFPYYFTEYEAGGVVGTDVWQPCSVLETKVYVLSVSHPAKRKCLIMDTDQPVTDNFFLQIYLLSIIPWAILCYCSS